MRAEWSCYLGNGGEGSDWSIETKTERGEMDVDPTVTHTLKRRRDGQPEQSLEIEDGEVEALFLALRWSTTKLPR